MNMNMNMNPQFDDDELALMSEYYPEGIISQLQPVPEQGAAENVKVRRRRRKGKGGEGGGVMRKRKLSEEQLNMLERSFGNEHKLETERKDQLAAELGLDPRQVAVWFQNRRARWKTKKLEEEFARLRSHHESTVVEKCRLQTEILKMKEQLNEAEKEIERLSERGERLRSNSPSSSVLSTDTNNIEPQFAAGFGLMEYLDNVFYVEPETNYPHAFQWDDHMYNYI